MLVSVDSHNQHTYEVVPKGPHSVPIRSITEIVMDSFDCDYSSIEPLIFTAVGGNLRWTLIQERIFSANQRKKMKIDNSTVDILKNVGRQPCEPGDA